MPLQLTLRSIASSMRYETSAISLVTNNISNNGSEFYNRRVASELNDSQNSHVIAYARQESKLLQNQLVMATSQKAHFETISHYLGQIRSDLTDFTAESGLHTSVGLVINTLNLFYNDPGNDILGIEAIDQVKNLVTQVKESALQLFELRQRLNTDCAESVERLNQLVSEYAHIESRNSTPTNAFLSDKRDKLIMEISELVPIRVLETPERGLCLYTQSGFPLYDGEPYRVQMSIDPHSNLPSFILPAGILPMSSSGQLSAYSHLMAESLDPALKQLDTVASILIRNFSEVKKNDDTDTQSYQGLVRTVDAPARVDNIVGPGLARIIDISDAVDVLDRSYTLLRDGGFADPGNDDFNTNSNGLPGYSLRIGEIVDRMEDDFLDESESGGSSYSTLIKLSKTPSFLIGGALQQANLSFESALTSVAYLRRAYSQEVGVNLDAETADLLELKNNYEANAQSYRVITDMMNTLFELTK